MAIHSRPEADPTREMPFLAGVDAESRAVLARFLDEATAPTGTPLMSQGQPNDRLWFVVRGTVAIDRVSAGGRSETLATLPAPSVFGTTTFFRPETPASATIRADSDLHLWTLDRDAHERLRREEPRAAEALASAIVRILSERFDLLDRRLAGQMAKPEDVRDRSRSSELSAFRARLFEEPGI